MNKLCAVIALLGICFIPWGTVFSSEVENASPEYREITWEQLIPESWQGNDIFESQDLNRLSDDDPAAGKTIAAYAEKMKNAPANQALAGKYVKIHGYVVPLEWDNESAIMEFLLAPYFGACIHVPPPPQNQIIHVRLDEPVEGLRSMETVLVQGKISIDNDMPDIYNSAYSMKSARLERTSGQKMSRLLMAAGMTLLSGLSICFAWIFIYKKLDSRWLCAGISFSAGIMLSIGISTLFRQTSRVAVYSFLGGIACISMIKYQWHGKNRGKRFLENARHTGKHASLVIAAHNLPECFALFSVAVSNPVLGFALASAIVAHNIPLGFSVALPVSHEEQGRHAWRYAALMGFVPPLAAIMIHLLMRPFFSPENLNVLIPGVGGIMALLSITELAPSARQYGGRSTVFCGYCLGILFALSTLIFFPLGG
jgi:zinc transporter ZupT